MADGKLHSYAVSLRWVGNQGTGTSAYRAYSRDHELASGAKPPIPGSSDANFRGDAARWNPEEMLVASLSSCHQLWYLHMCSANGVIVLAYEDEASGQMQEEADGAGQFVSATLRPRVTIAAGCDADLAKRLHHEAAKMCFIARSVNFPVGHEPEIIVQG